MTSFFPDLNVWIALSVGGHPHSEDAWNWIGFLPTGSRLIFARYTQIGLLRILTNKSAMGQRTLTLQSAWNVYERWLSDPRVQFYPEPRGLDATFRRTTARFASKAASQWVGDCYLLAYAHESDATLVTFDRGLLALAQQCGYAAVLPG